MKESFAQLFTNVAFLKFNWYLYIAENVFLH